MSAASQSKILIAAWNKAEAWDWIVPSILLWILSLPVVYERAERIEMGEEMSTGFYFLHPASQNNWGVIFFSLCVTLFLELIKGHLLRERERKKNECCYSTVIF